MPDAEWCTPNSGNTESIVRQLNDAKVIAIDTETTGLKYMTDIPLYWSLSWEQPDGGFKRACLKAEVLPLFDRVFADEEKDWVFVNAKYDTHILQNVGVQFAGRLLDTCVMHALLYEEHPHGLKEMAEQLLGWRWRGFEDTFGKIDRSDPQYIQNTLRRAESQELSKLVEYASNDAYGTLMIYRHLKEELQDARIWSLYPQEYPTLWEYFTKLEVPFTRVLWTCERNGNYIDRPYLKAIEGPVQKDIERIQKEANHLLGRMINLNSPKQLQQYFFTEKQYKPLKLTKGGKTGVRQPSVDADFLDVMAKRGEPLAKLTLEFRELSKLLGTYVVGLQEALDIHGRVHTKYNQDVARTGRLSSSEPNLQNIPRPDGDKFGIRKAFIAEPGNTLIVADYEQLEMRLLAAAAMEQDMIDIFLRGHDIHMGNAAFIYEIPYEDIVAAKKTEKKVKNGELPEEAMTDYYKKCLDYRQEVKTIGFGLNYGMREQTLAKRLGCTEEQALEKINRYMARYPAVKHFFDEAIESARQTGYAFTVLGRRRFLGDIISQGWSERGHAERQASNVPIQGSAADVAKCAMLKIHARRLWDEYGWHMLMQVHDELVFEGPEENVDEVMTIISEDMQHPFPTDLAVPLTISIGKGHSWAQAK